MRQHAGQFPVYAVFEDDKYKCFTVAGDGKTMERGNKEISALGVANF